MLDELHIRDLGVIEDATLRFSPGLTVVTGETGAGKTMVVTALQLLLGARADTSVVRSGSEAAVVETRIAPVPASAAEWVEEGGQDELIVAREVLTEGRSRVRINGRMATVGALAEMLGDAVEVHAQHEHVRLERPDVQRRLLDRYAGDPHARTLTTYHETYAAWQEAVRARERLHDDARERARERDRLEFEVQEIERAALHPDADGRLGDQLDVLEHAEELQLAAAQAEAALGSEGAGEPLGIAVQTLRGLRVDDHALHELRQRVEGLVAEASELAADVRDYGQAISADPQRLEELRERKLLVAALQRKYGADVEAVIAYGDDARARLDELERADADASDLDARLDELERALGDLAADVTRGRGLAAEGLAVSVDGHLQELGMPHAAFQVSVAPAEGSGQPAAFGPDGVDRVTFLLAANPGEPARPLSKAASGGERSRVALAVEVALADVNDAQVLVFDEVDAGIGGATAMAVGEKLARLSAGRQVLCVTHLAQLAAFADVHHVVEKGVRDGRTVTEARQVADQDRVAELSRMLSGDPTRDAALGHARELLDEARTRRAG
ncbi:MAG TPA: DNA repair protein RecN [Nitriliruptorales bacterium]